MTETSELIEALQEAVRECRRKARSFDSAVKALLKPQRRTPGAPVNPKRDLLNAIKKSGLTYAQIASKVGCSYRYVSWVARGVLERPALEAKIRDVLCAGDAT